MTMLVRKTIPLPAWLPADVRMRLAGREFRIDIPKAVKLRLRPPRKISVSEHAVKYRIVTEVDSNPGPWRADLVPHLGKIMDLFGLLHVRELWVCMPERAGKTQVLMNAVHWFVDRGGQSGNIFWLLPKELDARQALSERLIPMFRASQRTSRLLSPKADDATSTIIRFTNGLRLRAAWANSPGSMASYFGRLNIADECDKFPKRTSEGTDPVTLFRKRAREDRWGSKYVFASTPANRFIYAGVMSCQQIWSYQPCCPFCGGFAFLAEEHLIIQEGASPADLTAGNVGIACPSCGAIWDESARRHAYQAGRWACTKGGGELRPESVGIHLDTFPLPMVPLMEIAAAWLRAQAGGTAEKTAWANGYKVVDYKQEHKERYEDRLLLLCDQRPDGVVPTWADTLEISIDTQKHGFWYRIRAWEYGPHMQSALVRAGYVGTLEALDTLIYKSDWRDAEGLPHRIMAGIIDTQGSQEGGYTTAQVYDWCRRKGSVVLAARGASGRKSVPVTVGKVDHYPGTNKPIPGGLRLYHIDTHFHKDELARKLDITPGDPGCFWLHSGYTAGQLAELAANPSLPLPTGLGEYTKQMCSEYRDERGLWQNRDGKPNHLWDCEANGLALVLYLGIQRHEKAKEGAADIRPAMVARSNYINRQDYKRSGIP